MADKPTKSVLPLVAIGAVLLVGIAILAPKLGAGFGRGSSAMVQPVPPPDAFDAGQAGLSVGAELEYAARVIGDWRRAGGDCSRPIEVRSDDGVLTIRDGQIREVLDLGLIKPGIVRAAVREPAAQAGAEVEFSVGLLGAVETPRAAITVARAGAPAETWEPCPAR